jgi:DNA-directed RNA polymerase subunit RPC12/RpoP
MPDDRQLARDILSGKVKPEEVARLRRTTVPPPVQAAPRAAAADAAQAPSPPPPPQDITEPPVQKPPVMTSTPETGRKFPCKQCGARLDFDPSQRALKCPYCGHVEEIAPAKTQVVERDYARALEKLAQGGDQGTIAGRSSEVRCPGCGANVLLEDNVETDRCPFCATHLVNVPRERAHDMLCPESVLPFAITQRQAIGQFTQWIGSRWFAPSNLKNLANLGQLSGVYLPFWTYDSMTYTHYTGMRGDDYWVTETYTTTENGQTVQRTRQVRKTRWTYVSGEVDHFFDDVLVCASRSLPANDVNELEPWDLGGLEGFRPEFLSGFKTERYTVPLDEGFQTAQGIMDSYIRQLCRQDIGGDHQQLNSVQTQHVGVTFKHILLPMWLAVYRYAGQTYRILVNARTGEVTGARPYSWIKITFAILAALIVLLIIFFLVRARQGH